MVHHCILFFFLVFGIVEFAFHPKECEATPTVLPAARFDAIADAVDLKRAIDFTKRNEIIAIFTKRIFQQRLMIAEAYSNLYKRNLVEDLESVRVHLDVLVEMLTPLPEYYAKELHEAFTSPYVMHDDIITILCTQTLSEIGQMQLSYQKLYKKNFIHDLESPVRRLIYGLCVANRNESHPINEKMALSDARALLRAKRQGDHQLRVDDAYPFLEFLQKHTHQQTRRTMHHFNRVSEESFQTAIFLESLDLDIAKRNCIMLIVKCIYSRIDCLAYQLIDSMNRFLMKMRTVTRIIVTRSEIDLFEIKETVRLVSDNNTSLEKQLSEKIAVWHSDVLIPLVNTYYLPPK